MDRVIGYARCGVDEHDQAAQHERLVELGVIPERVYLDQGLTGAAADRPGLAQALAAAWRGDLLVAPSLVRLARSPADAGDIAGRLADGGVWLSLGGQVFDPADPVGARVFTDLALFAEFSAELARLRIGEGMTAARTNGRLRGGQRKTQHAAAGHAAAAARHR